MSFNEDLVRQALYAAFSNKVVGDTMNFPTVDPVYTNGTTLGAAPSSTNSSGLLFGTYEMKRVYVFLKYGFTISALSYIGILDNEAFKDRVKYYFLNSYQEYILSIIPPNAVFKSPSLDDLLFNVNELTSRRICTISFELKYWELLP